MIYKDGKLDERSQRILSEQTVPPRYGSSPGMQGMSDLIDHKMVDDFVAALQMPGADREIAMDTMADHMPEAMAALGRIETGVNHLRLEIRRRANEKANASSPAVQP